ncbi:MAG: hypothetical protein N3A59_09210, partial [Thermodesulfovibrionales bacterium]|nr:hypothetical protein [Thermodesulfovibrionales bacterium]
DDEFYPEHISSVIPLLTSLDYHIAYTDTEIIYRKYDLNKKALENTEKKVFRSKDFSYEDMLLENYIPIISVMFSRDVFSTVDKFDESLDIYEDWDYLIRCSQHYHFYHIHKATTKYIQWSDAYQVAQTKKYEKLIEKFYTKVIEKHKTRFSPEIIKYYRDQINMLYSKLMDRDAIIERLEQTLHKKDSEIKALEQKLDAMQAQLNLIMSSKGWRLLCKFYKIKDFLLNIQKLK